MGHDFFIWNMNPTLLRLGVLELRWYGLLFAFGFYLSFKIMEKVYEWEFKSQNDVGALLNWLVFSTLIGARLGHCFFYEPGIYLAEPWRIPMIWEGGLASHGAAIGVVCGLYFYSKSRKYLSFLWVCDRVAILATLSGAFIRLGNFMNSEIIGIPTQVPWAIVFSRVDQIPRHPAQLYESIFYLIQFFIFSILFLKTSLKNRPGFFMGAYFLTTFIFRYFIEFVKELQVSSEASLPLHLGQFLSIPFIILGLFLMIKSFKKKTV